MIADREKAIDIILDALRNGQPEYQACQAGGIKFATWWVWKQEMPGLKLRIDQAKQSRIEFMDDAIYKAGLKGDWRAAVVYLERYDSNWRDRLKDSVGGSSGIGSAIQNMISAMDPEKKQKFLSALHLSGLLGDKQIIDLNPDNPPSTNGHSNGNGSNGAAH